MKNNNTEEVNVPRCATCAKFLRYFQGKGACRQHFTDEGVPYNCSTEDYCSAHKDMKNPAPTMGTGLD